MTAIQALRRTLSPLHVPSAPMPVFAEHLKKEYETFKNRTLSKSPTARPLPMSLIGPLDLCPGSPEMTSNRVDF